MPYGENLAAALTGASPRQLGHWRRTGVIDAERSTETRVFYSYRDLVAVRTCVYLRQESSLQRIRTAIGNLREFGEIEHLSNYKLVNIGPTIALMQDEESALDLVRHPGHEVMVQMRDVVAEFTTEQGRRVLNLNRPFENVSIDPSVRAGYPVIAGTRVSFSLITGLLADGVPPEDISTFYPTVSSAAAQDALAFESYVSELAAA